MRQQLRQVYEDLHNGRLSQSAALEKIKVLKLQEQAGAPDTMLAVPRWQDAETGSRLPRTYAEHHVILSEAIHLSVEELFPFLPATQLSHLPETNVQHLAQCYTSTALACFERIKYILSGRPQRDLLLQIVIPANGDHAVLLGLVGLVKTAALENPQFTGQLLMVPASIEAGDLARCVSREMASVQDVLVRYDRGIRRVMRWQEVNGKSQPPARVFTNEGAYLITGGLGGLGVLFAREILSCAPQASIILTGRFPLNAKMRASLDKLSASSAQVTYRRLDLGNLQALNEEIDSIQNEMAPLAGILHCAGVAQDNFILKKTREEFLQTLVPKVAGSFNLDQATQSLKLDFFVLFSSVAGAMGNVGQADYATACGFLDQFAAHRNALVTEGQRYGITRSINWGLWQDGGMRMSADRLKLLQQATGIEPIPASMGMRAFYRALSLPHDQCLVLAGELARMRTSMLSDVPADPQQSPLLNDASLAAPAEIDSDTLSEKTQEYLRGEFAEILRLPRHKIDSMAALEVYGIDSILAMKLTTHLEKSFGLLPKTLFFEYQTIHELSLYFVQLHASQLQTLFALPAAGPQDNSGAAKQPEQVLAEERLGLMSRFNRPARRSDPEKRKAVAIIGLSGRYPRAETLLDFWRNLCEGKDCITEVPRERWNWQEYFSEDRTREGHHFSKWGGFIAGVDEFDPLFFNIAPKDAKLIDPQERLFLQHAWMAVEDAGYTRVSMQAASQYDLPAQVGVYAGVMYNEYQLLGVEASRQGKRLGIAGSAASVANRVSSVLNLHGPSVALDTMCSSSLTAIHYACQDLKQGRTSLAIAGGVNVSVHPNKYLLLSAGQFISSGGHCQSFGEGGDGFIPAEGVGVVVLKRLSDAERDGDHIYGVIRGSAINHGGKTNGYTVPNPQAQSSVIGQALAESGISARAISYVEAHGTGTRLGDPIEIAALSRAYQQYTPESGYCLIGSVKSNIGHCESAAGIAGLTKVLLQLQHRQIVPSLHAERLNPHIDFLRTPFEVNQRLREWEQPEVDGRKLPRMAGVSSFGAGGSNAHLVVEEYVSAAPARVGSVEVLVLLSARREEQLRGRVQDLVGYLAGRAADVDLESLSYTLQVGREAMEERLAIVAGSVEELVRKLQGYLAGALGIDTMYRGNVKRGEENLAFLGSDTELRQTTSQWIASGKHARLAEVWVRGLEFDWKKLYSAALPRRMSLPPYPFARERYWIDLPVRRPEVAAALHPLLHANTSDVHGQRYSTTFSEQGRLFDYQLQPNGQALQGALPGALWLEMARVAIQQFSPSSEATALELREVVCGAPTVLGEKTEVHISLWTRNDGDIGYEVYTQDAGKEVICSQGHAHWGPQQQPSRLNLAKLRLDISEERSTPESLYVALIDMGLVCGSSFQSIVAIHQGNRQLLAQLRLPAALASGASQYALHPSLIEGALQAVFVLMDRASTGRPYSQLAFALGSLHIVSSCPQEVFAWVRHASRSEGPDKDFGFDIDLCDQHGEVCAQVRGLGWEPALEAVDHEVEASSIEVQAVPAAVVSDPLPPIIATLKTLLAQELQIRESDINDHVQFVDLGLDSVTGVTWVRKINEKYRAAIEAIQVYSHPTLVQLGRHVLEQITGLGVLLGKPAHSPVTAPMSTKSKPRMARAGSQLASSRRAPDRGSRRSSQPIAVIGIAGRFPEAGDVQEFWQNIAQGRNCITQVSRDRWNAQTYYRSGEVLPGTTNSQWFGAMQDYDCFDPQFFSISPKEAESMDPQQRLLLEACWHAIEDGGYAGRSLSGTRCGIFVGCTQSDYQLLSREHQLSAHGFTGNACSILAGRISYFLDLQGPCLSIDTACSSSLVALASACDSLLSGASDVALGGGVYVMAGPQMHIKTAQAGMLSSRGVCATFDQQADGFVPGEGVGVVMLKRLSDAERDGDRIYGLIEGWGVNQDGKTNGITAPNPDSQARLQQEVYERFGIDASEIQLIEAHGTGTKLGDPIEVEGLKKAFRKYTRKPESCAIGSVKSNIGHCLTAAGIAGFLKLILSLQHRQLPPTIHFEQLNEHIDLSDSPFYVNRHLQPWLLHGASKRRAAINSLGFSGTNAHLVVAEYQAHDDKDLRIAPARVGSVEVLVLLSARREEQLRGRVQDLVGYLAGRAADVDLESLSYTLQVGREAMEERLAIVAGSVEELVRKLQGYLAGALEVEGVYAGQSRSNKELVTLFSRDADLQQAVEKWIAAGKWGRLLELWVKGVEVDWSRLYGERKPRRMSLPVYPFARERYWIEVSAANGGGVAAPAGSGPVLHPLLHRNTSDLRQQRYSTRLRGEEGFLMDQAGGRIVPGWVYLEMVRAALDQAMGGAAPNGWELGELAWGEPLAAQPDVELHLAVLAGEGERLGFEIYSEGAVPEVVHCQGWAQATSASSPARLAVGPLGDGNGELWVQLPAPESGYVLAPGVLGAAFAAAQRWSGSPSSLPGSLRGARLVSACAPEPLARIRHGREGLDIDLCDRQGQVWAELRGLAWQAASPATVEARGSEQVSSNAPGTSSFVPVELAWQPAAVSGWAGAAVMMEKPRGLRLQDATGPWPVAEARKPSVTLHAVKTVDARDTVRISEEAAGVFYLKMGEGAGMVDLAQALERVEQEPSLQVLRLGGLEHCFAAGGRVAYHGALEQRLYASLVRFPAPVIATLPGGGVGALWLAASLCDLLVLDEQASYGYVDSAGGVYATAAEAALLEERFGRLLARQLLYGPGPLAGWELRARGYTVRMVAAGEVESEARRLAVELAAKPRRALRLLKRHLVRRLPALVDSLGVVEPVVMPQRAAGEVVVLPLGHPQGAWAWLREFGRGLEAAIAGGARAVVIAGGTTVFSSAEAAGVREEFARLVRSSAVPVVSALDHGGQGSGWLLGQVCDGSVFSREGVYAVAEWSEEMAALLLEVLGQEMGLELLLGGGEYRGAVLEQRVCGLRAAEADQVLAVARELAEFWADLPPATLAMWRQRSADVLAAWQNQLSGLCASPVKPSAAFEPGPIALRSTVVTATAGEDGVVVVRMEDRAARNMFSRELQEGMSEVFAHIGLEPGYRAVVLTGYDSYFSSGGTRESLLAIQAGEVQFTDIKLFQLPLDCRLPVIAVMQGHGIGAGLSLGMFADLVLLSEESRYESPYMSYGFTPGAGATWVLGEKLGADVARESLLTAAQYSGRKLRHRGVRLAVAPRAASLAAALELAGRIAARPLFLATELKARLRAGALSQLEETYRLELAMHAETFVGQPDTLAQIERSFERQASPAATPQPVPQPQAVRTETAPLGAIVAGLKALLAAELHLQESEIDEDVEFVDLGLDSISGVTWLRAINAHYQTAIEITKVYSYPTLTQLARHIRQEAEKQSALPQPPTAPAPTTPAATKPAATTPATTSAQANRHPLPAPSSAARLSSWRKPQATRFAAAAKAPQSTAPAPTPTPHPIAVIGMAGQFPQAENLNQFWLNLAQGKNCISPIPKHRWNLDNFYGQDPKRNEETSCKWLGVLDNADCFDPLFFRISPQEAEYIDPQQRLFLQEAYRAFEDSGYCPRTLSNMNCGVYVGISAHEYPLLLAQHGVHTMPITSNSNAIAAGRVAYHLNLKGPAISLDTACSSSLVAIHLACQGLWSGETDMALAGGVSLWLNAQTQVSMCQAGATSSTGQCRTFDESADGVVLSDGVGAIVLKRLEDAQADNDFIYGVIMGSGINQDGRTNGITAPSVLSQADLQKSIYTKFNIDPETITYVETHGAGSALGDPIELEALTTSFRESTSKKNYCALGSAKSSIGHSAAAAGVAGVIKVLLSLRNQTLAPIGNLKKQSSHFDFDNSPFYVCRESRPWLTPGTLRRAAVNSFGYSGTNAHLVIEEYATPAASIERGIPCLVPISAKTPEQLRHKVKDLLEFIRSSQSPKNATAKFLDLPSIAYTLQVGRETMEVRLGWVTNSVEELAEKLSAYLEDAKASDIRLGRVHGASDRRSANRAREDAQGAVDECIAQRDLPGLLDLWMGNAQFDWDLLWRGNKPQRISLPGYPFARQRCWVPVLSEGDIPSRPYDDEPDMALIERLVEQIDADEIETIQAVNNLRAASMSIHQTATKNGSSSEILQESF